MTVKTALVLAGHGSHISPNTAGLVWEQVDKLRALNIVDEVTAAFWKEMPSFHTVFDSLEATDITVVPLFTAQGYFTQTVIPAEMGLTGAITQRDGRIIRYTRTLGEHPYLFNVVEGFADGARRILKTSASQTAVAIIGHSTRRNPDSRKAVESQVAHLREKNIYAQVEAVYLDDAPAIADIYAMTSAPNLIAIPFFLADGSHTTIDVARELGLDINDPAPVINGRRIFYTPPVGLTHELPNMILELARNSGAPLRASGQFALHTNYPLRGMNVFIQIVASEGEMRFGDLFVSRHNVHLWGDDHPSELIDDPADLRRYVRENPFRPLATSSDLPSGWQVQTNHWQYSCAVVETVYPGAIADWAAHRNGTFRANTFVQTVDRQTGQYRQLEQLTPVQTQTIVKQICGKCVRHATWFHGESPADAIPCPEPCNFWLSAAVKELNEKETK